MDAKKLLKPVSTLLLLENSQFPSSYVWAKPKHIEFAQILVTFLLIQIL